VSQLDELSHDGQGWTGSILEDHIDVLDTKSGKVRRAVELRVESNDQSDITVNEVGKDILEWLGDSGMLYLWDAGW
jgi:hypothetical protein